MDAFIGLSTEFGGATGLDGGASLGLGEMDRSGIIKMWTDNLKGCGSHLTVSKLKDNVLFVAVNGRIAAFDALSGDEIWMQYPESQKGSLQTSSFLDLILPKEEDCLYYTQAGRIVKLDARDGHVIWDQNSCVSADTKYGTVTLLDGGRYLLSALQGYVVAFDKFNGGLVWKNDLKGKGYSPVTIALHENILIAGINGYLVSLNLHTGETIAQFNLDGTGFSVVTLLMDPVNFGVLYAACYGECRAFMVHNGVFKQIWKSGLSGMGYSEGHSLYLHQDSSTVRSLIIGMAGKVCALDPLSGRTKWRNGLSGCGYSFVTLNDFTERIILAASNGKLVGIDKESGHTEWVDGLDGLGYCGMVVATSRQNIDFNSTTLPHYFEEEQDNN